MPTPVFLKICIAPRQTNSWMCSGAQKVSLIVSNVNYNPVTIRYGRLVAFTEPAPPSMTDSDLSTDKIIGMTTTRQNSPTSSQPF